MGEASLTAAADAAVPSTMRFAAWPHSLAEPHESFHLPRAVRLPLLRVLRTTVSPTVLGTAGASVGCERLGQPCSLALHPSMGSSPPPLGLALAGQGSSSSSSSVAAASVAFVGFDFHRTHFPQWNGKSHIETRSLAVAVAETHHYHLRARSVFAEGRACYPAVSTAWSGKLKRWHWMGWRRAPGGRSHSHCCLHTTSHSRSSSPTASSAGLAHQRSQKRKCDAADVVEWWVWLLLLLLLEEE